MNVSGLVKNRKARAKPSVHKIRTLSRSKLLFHALDIISNGEIYCNWTLNSHDLLIGLKGRRQRKSQWARTGICYLEAIRVQILLFLEAVEMILICRTLIRILSLRLMMPIQVNILFQTIKNL